MHTRLNMAPEGFARSNKEWMRHPVAKLPTPGTVLPINNLQSCGRENAVRLKGFADELSQNVLP